MKKISHMTAREYLANLREQLLNNVPLEHFFLVDDNEICSLKGSTTEHKYIKAAHNLLRECRGKGFEILCHYLLQNLVFQPTYEIHERITHLAGKPSVRKKFELIKTKKLLDNYIQNAAQEDLFNANFMLSAWDRLSKKEKAIVLSIVGSGALSLTMNSISLKAGGGIPAMGPGVLGSGAKIGTAQRELMLNDIRQGIQSKTRMTGGSPGIKILKSAPAVVRDILKVNVKQSVQPKLISKGGKGFVKINKNIKSGKTSGKSRAAMLLTFGFIGVLSGGSNVQAHKEHKVVLSYSEWLNVFFRGFIWPLVSVNPHSEQVGQYLKEKAIADQLAEQGTKFLEAFPQFDTYFVGLGQLSENKNKEEFTAVPGFSYADLDQERPDLGEKDLVSEFRLGAPLGKVKIHYKKSRRTPTLVSANTELVCAPEFDAIKEVADSGLNDMAAYQCKNGFAIRNKIRATNLPAKVYYDLSLTNKGKIIGSRENINIVDVSKIPGNGLYYVDNVITTTSTTSDEAVRIEAYNIHNFIGRPNLVDRVTCSSSLVYVATQGGVGSGIGFADELYECPNGLLSPHTYVHSGLLESHQYDIELGNGTIDINLLKAKNVILKFNLSTNDLLARVVIRRNESSENDFVKLVLTIDETKVVLHLLKSASVILLDNQEHQIFFQANEFDSFLMLEQIAENVSSEEKLQVCHTYQQHTPKDKQLACLMVKVAETEVIEDIFVVDGAGQGWSFIADTEGEIDLIPFYGKGVYSLTAYELEKNPSLHTSFPVTNIKYYKDRDDLILVGEEHTSIAFLLRLKNYYADPLLWKSLRLINIDAEVLFNCDTGELCLSGEALTGYSREAISFEDEIKAREEQLFTYYLLMPEQNVANQTIYHNQQLSVSGESQTVIVQKERLGYLKVEDFNFADIKVHAEDSDLIFRIEAGSVSKNIFEFRFKNWDSSSSHRLEGIIFSGFDSENLSGFLSEDADLVERRLKKLIMKAKAYDEAKQLLIPLQLARLQVLLVDKLFGSPWPALINKKAIIAKSLGFQDEKDLANFYFISMSNQGKNSASKLFNSEASLQKTTQTLYWLAVHTCLVSNDSTVVNKLFPMLISSEMIKPYNKSLCQQVHISTATLSSSLLEQFILSKITPKRLEEVKNWLMEASNRKRNISFFYKPIVQQANLDGFIYPSLSSSDRDIELSDFIYHSRYTDDEWSGTEEQGFIDLNDMPDIVGVNVSQEDEWFKFTFISNGKFNYRPMKVKWNDPNQRIEGIIKDNDVVEGLTALDDPALIEARINTVFSPEREWQVEEPRVGAQVHSGYQEEQMLGDQPVNGFIHEESHASHSMAPLQISTNAANSPSLMGIITNGVEVNSTLLALQMLLRNKVSSPIPNFSLESKNEARMEELMLTVEAAFKKEWEESESETSGGYWKNWLIGGLGGAVGLIAGLVWWVKKGRSKNLSSHDVEQGTTLALNPSNISNAGNDEYSLNSIPPNECVPLFSENEEGGGSNGSSNFLFASNAPISSADMKGKGSNSLSSFPFCIDNSFAANGREKTKNRGNLLIENA